MRVRFSFSSKFARKNRKPDNTNQHKIAFSKQVLDVIGQSDIVLEILDARFIDKTRNLVLENEVKKQKKKIIYVLNKADLIEIKELKKNYDLASIQPYVLFSAKSRIGRARLREVLNIEASRIKFKKARVGIIGYPNTGKSTLINVLAGGRKASTSSQEGHTKAIQKIRFNDHIVILDSPGIISGGEENSLNSAIVTKQTEIGVKGYGKVKYPDLVVNEIMKENPKIFDDYYGVDSENDAEVLLEILGKKWNFVKKGGDVDQDRTARRILKDWQEGKITPKIKA